MFKVNILSKSVGATATSIRKPMLEKFQIPIPPLELQKEIVKRLDILTELEAELSLRKKQYQYYRDFLLPENELAKVGFEWKLLGEVCHKIYSGKNKEKNIHGFYPVYGSTGIIGKTDNFVYNQELILVARVGANAGFVHIASGKYDVSDNTLIVQNGGDIDFKYLFYYLVYLNLNKFAKGGGQPLITSSDLKKIKIPIPPLKNQAKIVAILDKFDRLTSSITDGLPKEIELRRKQYEYYRELLLGFGM